MVIQQPLAVSVCPLPTGVCTWKHQQTGVCQFDPLITEIKISELAARVGLVTPSDTSVQKIKLDLHEAIKAALK